MNPQNKQTFMLTNRDNTEINGHMQFYIDYACKMFYPNLVRVLRSSNGKSVHVMSRDLMKTDCYDYFVDFDDSGKFVKGVTYFNGDNSEFIRDQTVFKQKIKREINELNALHGTVEALIESVRSK